MGKFVGEFDLSPYPDGKTWFLLNPVSYVCDDGFVVEVPKGRETDFASVPALFTNIFPRWDTYGFAALIHDECYWGQTVTRERADAIFLEGMIVLNVPVWKRQCLYRAVRWFGESAWSDNALMKLHGVTRIGTPNSPPIPEWPR
jgi:hypothetical protein